MRTASSSVQTPTPQGPLEGSRLVQPPPTSPAFPFWFVIENQGEGQNCGLSLVGSSAPLRAPPAPLPRTTHPRGQSKGGGWEDSQGIPPAVWGRSGKKARLTGHSGGQSFTGGHLLSGRVYATVNVVSQCGCTQPGSPDSGGGCECGDWC